MYVFYEDDGSFKAGNILSETDASLQVESESGKRSRSSAPTPCSISRRPSRRR